MQEIDILDFFEKKFKSSINIERLIDEVKCSFEFVVNETDEDDIAEDDIDQYNLKKKKLIDALDKGNCIIEFKGIKVYLLNSTSRSPYFLACLDVLTVKNSFCVARYEVEYGIVDEEIIMYDDYFTIFDSLGII